MQNFVHEMLHDSPGALKIMSLWEEYEDQSTAEARFVKGEYLGFGPDVARCFLVADVVPDLDRFEMAAQALEYEQAHGSQTLQPFFDSSLPHLRHTEVREWGADLLREREEMHARAGHQHYN
jgi:putative hydrolase of HD superfamily